MTATAAAVAVLAALWEAAAAVVVLAASAASWGLVEAKWAAVVTREARRAAVVRPEARGAVAAKAALVLKAALAAATATMAEMVAAVARVQAKGGVGVTALDRRRTHSTWCSRRSRCHRRVHTMPGQCTPSKDNNTCPWRRCPGWHTQGVVAAVERATAEEGAQPQMQLDI